MLRVRYLEGRHRKLLLSGDAQGCPARCDHFECGACTEKLSNDRRRGKDLLEVVEHKQHPLVLEVIDQTRERQLRATHLHAEGVRDRRRNELRVGDGRERDEECAVAESGRRLLRDAQRQSGLSCPSRPGEGHEPRALQKSLTFGDLARSSDERRRLRRQERRRPIEAADGREVRGGPNDHELIDPLRPCEVL